VTPPSKIIGSGKAQGIVIISVLNRMEENILNSFYLEIKRVKAEAPCLYISICDIFIARVIFKPFE